MDRGWSCRHDGSCDADHIVCGKWMDAYIAAVGLEWDLLSFGRQRVTVTDTDQDYVYISFTMDGEPTVDVLKFTDETRIKAETRILFCWLLRMRL